MSQCVNKKILICNIIASHDKLHTFTQKWMRNVEIQEGLIKLFLAPRYVIVICQDNELFLRKWSQLIRYSAQEANELVNVLAEATVAIVTESSSYA